MTVTISLQGVDTTGAVTGNVYSSMLSGPFTGSVGVDGGVVGAVANTLDSGHVWTLNVMRVSSGLNVTSATYGAASLGSSSCTATPSLTVDMSGPWVGYMVKMDWLDSAPVTPIVLQNVSVDLAYGGGNSFVGAVVSDAGLAGKIVFEVSSGAWFSYIENAFSWGSMIAVPRSGSILTQSAIASTTSMTDSFTSNLTAPFVMQGMGFTTAYDITLPNGTSAPTSDTHRLYLVRPGSSLTCPSGYAWSTTSNKCSAI